MLLQTLTFMATTAGCTAGTLGFKPSSVDSTQFLNDHEIIMGCVPTTHNLRGRRDASQL